ncbi:DNA double-strand break repair nuclease NurA [Metallosphaera tengchongensis]|uniref:DNA double-strand break repair nuclease NurA n=1 Tax=Metallosphaera tengchongensis TaxID=1532350 RepID=A0A6N0NYT4_9CREN|nr:DNA double-strand break repair nuclease NurA [Metallosphaera tengchongensis]QKR00719.1 DNA double-strand break repair nuclease NurA [Metallosphaera tengchongensis]
MEFQDAVKDLMNLLSALVKSRPFLGEITSAEVEAGTVEEVGNLEDCDPFKSFSYLDSSSRTLTVRGANIHMASLYAYNQGTHVMIPPQTSVPFIAVKASDEVLKAIESRLPNVVSVRNPDGVLYTPEYKDDNILDELRVNLENYVINQGNVTIADGPVFPGPFLPTVGEPYRSAYETLIKARKTDKLVGVVKRLSMTRKLSRVMNSKASINATDDVVMLELGRGKEVYLSPVLKEDHPLSDRVLTRYMVYVKVRDSVFRVESSDPSLLCPGVKTSLKSVSVRGIPTFIEVSDKLSRRLSASALLLSFGLAKEMVGVNYEDWNRVNQANLELME